MVQINNLLAADPWALPLTYGVNSEAVKWATNRSAPPCGGCQGRLVSDDWCLCETTVNPAPAPDAPMEVLELGICLAELDPMEYEARNQIGLLRLLAARFEPRKKSRGRVEDATERELFDAMCHAYEEAGFNVVDGDSIGFVKLLEDLLAINELGEFRIEYRVKRHAEMRRKINRSTARARSRRSDE